ncbi:MAG: response regulator [Sandaracinaceae bacterium]|nr:MAG: response regulator [Sandaracinaceae bacterium]
MTARARRPPPPSDGMSQGSRGPADDPTTMIASATPSTAPRVLLVDDDESVVHALTRLLGRAGWEVRSSERAFGVLNLVAEYRPHVIVLDVVMPGLDGGQLTELLRSDPELARTRVVLHSGMDPMELEQRARLVEADGFVSKGGRPADLLETLRQFAA